MNRQIKVLMVVPNLRVSNGVASFAMSYYRNLNHERVKMDFVCYGNIESPYPHEIQECGDKVFFLPKVKNIANHIKKCKEIIDEGHYDIIHVNSLLITYPLLQVAKKKVKVRLLHSHNTVMGDTKRKELRNRIFLPFLLNSCNYFAACSTIAGNALFGKRPFTVIPNVIQSQKYKYNEQIRMIKREQENCCEKVVICAVGRLAHQKNPFFAIDVIEKLMEERQDVIFWWIGSGGLNQEVAEYASKKRFADRITLFGSREDVAELYQAMDVFFLPSKFEGFGLACLEAQASGLPCVISDQYPQEINVTGNVLQVPLNDSVDNWKRALLCAEKKYVDREEAFFAVNKSIFDAKVSGSVLESLYGDIISKEIGGKK